MKAICIRTSRYNKYDDLPLTLGKVYDVISITHIPFNASRQYDYTGPFFKLVNDRGELSGYTDDCVRLLTKEEEREERLKELGI
jgi:hypothetical protein